MNRPRGDTGGTTSKALVTLPCGRAVAPDYVHCQGVRIREDHPDFGEPSLRPDGNGKRAKAAGARSGRGDGGHPTSDS